MSTDKKKRGRPWKEEDKRSARLSVRVTPATKARFTEQARERGESLADMLARLVRPPQGGEE